MPTDPYVPTSLEDRPRQEQNLPPGIHLPPARAWRADRPGDSPSDAGPDWPEGLLFGSPGPNIGHAVRLVHEVSARMALGPHEPRHDAMVVAADLAMRRAAVRGRAPIPADVDVAFAILGYDGSATDDFVAWREGVVAAAGHDYPTRRELVDAVPADVLDLDVRAVAERAVSARVAMRAVVTLSAD